MTYPQDSSSTPLVIREQDIEEEFIEKLRALKYSYRPDIRDRAAIERNFRQKFEALNRVKLADGEFQRLLDELVTPDVFSAARVLREKNDFTRDDGTPLSYTLVNIRDWCKNDFEIVHQLRINTDYSHHRYDVLLLINGVPVVQVELKTLGVSPRRAMEQVVEYKNDPGNGYTRTLQAGQGLDQKEIEAGYRRFREERHAAELAAIAQKHGLAKERLQTFVDAILQRMVFDGEQLTELLESLGLAWRARRVAELALMGDLVPLLKKRAAGRDISGLSAYES